MKFSDFFVPKYIHSDPAVRLKFVTKSTDAKLLEQMAEKDADENVRKAALNKAELLKRNTQTA